MMLASQIKNPFQLFAKNGFSLALAVFVYTSGFHRRRPQAESSNRRNGRLTRRFASCQTTQHRRDRNSVMPEKAGIQ
jgi:hypothetical protein